MLQQAWACSWQALNRGHCSSCCSEGLRPCCKRPASHTPLHRIACDGQAVRSVGATREQMAEVLRQEDEELKRR